MTKKSLRQLKNERLSKEDLSKAAKEAGINADVDSLGDIGSIEDTIERYQNKNEDELMGELFEMVSRGRSDGSFSEEMLEQFVSNVSPMLDSDQKKKLHAISSMLKQKN